MMESVWRVVGARMDTVNGSTVLYGKDVRMNMNKTDHPTYDVDEFFTSFKTHGMWTTRNSRRSIGSSVLKRRTSTTIKTNTINVHSHL